MPMMRIDKLLSQSGFGSRKEVKGILKQGLVRIDGEIVKRPESKVNPEAAEIYVNDDLIEYEKYVYLMMNKPDGVISATVDDEETTVCDLLEYKYQWSDIFPVGRLDKDTVGLLILTNDGIFAHRSLSPKKHVDKVYYAKVNGTVTIDDAEIFNTGITLDDGYVCKPAALEILSSGQGESEIKLTIHEGKFHQVKRMFEALGHKVTYLKRTAFAGLELDESLAPGEYRKLNADEMGKIANLISKD